MNNFLIRESGSDRLFSTTVTTTQAAARAFAEQGCCSPTTVPWVELYVSRINNNGESTDWSHHVVDLTPAPPECQCERCTGQAGADDITWIYNQAQSG